MDANRDVGEATFGVPDAIAAYRNYSNFILKAKAAISGSGLLLDVHGQAHTTAGGAWIEIGYTIIKKRLNNGKFWRTLSSVNNLGRKLCNSESNTNNPCFKDLIRGTKKSLGHFMNLAELRAVPSPNDPYPEDEAYYSGGFTVKEYGSKHGGNIDAIQLEFPRPLRYHWPQDKEAVVSAILCYFKANYQPYIKIPRSVPCSE